jgi:Ni/Co efflux regulator RcnB
MKRILLIAAAAAFAAAPALAATRKAEHSANRTAAPATLHYIDKVMPDLWRTSEIKGVDVYNDQNQKIGSVDDVLVDQHGNVKAVVIGVGGFLGVGERNVAVPFNELHWQVNTTHTANGQRVAQDTDHPARATLPGVTKEQLQRAPEFKYAG